jgi:hypothetical protein
LDGHPNIITFHEQYDIYVYISLKKFFFEKLPLENLPDYLRKNLTYNFKLHQNIFNASLLKFDINIIYDQIEKIVKILIKKKITITFDLLVNIFFIAHASLNQKYISDTNYYILIDTHAPFDIDDNIFFFNKLNIHTLFLTLRDPVKSLDSHLFHHTFEHVQKPFNTLFFKMLILFNQSFITTKLDCSKKKVSLIKFEDLFNNTEATINKICNRLNIKVNDVMYKETNCGLDSDVFISNKKQIKGFRKISYPESLKILNENQIKTIEFLFSKIIKKNGYKFRLKRNFYLNSEIYDLSIKYYSKVLSQIDSSSTKDLFFLKLSISYKIFMINFIERLRKLIKKNENTK